MEAGSSGCIPIIYEYFKKDVPKTPDEYYLFKFTNENDINDFIIKTQNYEEKSIKTINYFELLNKNYIVKYDKIILEL
jgi:hypothetical protein